MVYQIYWLLFFSGLAGAHRAYGIDCALQDYTIIIIIYYHCCWILILKLSHSDNIRTVISLTEGPVPIHRCKHYVRLFWSDPPGSRTPIISLTLTFRNAYVAFTIMLIKQTFIVLWHVKHRVTMWMFGKFLPALFEVKQWCFSTLWMSEHIVFSSYLLIHVNILKTI